MKGKRELKLNNVSDSVLRIKEFNFTNYINLKDNLYFVFIEISKFIILLKT